MGELGLPFDEGRPLTVTGGLPYAGGPGNNHVMHAGAPMGERLRQGGGGGGPGRGPGAGRRPPPRGPGRRSAPAVDQAQLQAMASPPFLEQPPEAEAVIETYTVAFDRA